MLSGVMLIIVTMFAVLGAYYLSDLLTNCLFRRRKAAEALVVLRADTSEQLSLIHISEPTRLGMISYAVFCLKKKKRNHHMLARER